MKTILVVESIPLLRKMLCQLLSNLQTIDTEVITIDHDSLYEKLSLKPDWVWLDGTNPTIRNNSFLKSIKKLHKNLKVTVFGQQDSVSDIHRYYQQGIVGYLPKTASQEDIVQMIHCVSEGKVFVSSSLLTAVNDWMTTPTKNHVHYQLTPREKEVLGLIVEEYSTKEIAEKLFVSPCTIETHRLNLIQKLEVKNTAGLVRKAVQERLWGHWNFT